MQQSTSVNSQIQTEKNSNELEKKCHELELILRLNAKLGFSLDIDSVISVLFGSFKEFLPSIALGYVLTGLKNSDGNMKIHTQYEIGDKYVQAVKESLLLGLNTIPKVGESDLKNYGPKSNIIVVEDNLYKNGTDILPTENVNIPLIIPGSVAGLINLSSIQKNVFNPDNLKLVYKIIESASGTIQRLHGLVSKEINQIKGQAQELEKYREAIDNMSEIILFVDTNGAIRYANKASTKTGYATEEILEKSVAFWSYSNNEVFYNNILNAVRENRIPYKGMAKNENKNGQIHNVEIQMSPVLDGNRNIKFIVTTIKYLK